MLKKVFERVKMEAVVATFPHTALLTTTRGKAGIGRLLGKVALLKQMSSWQQEELFQKQGREAPWVGYLSHWFCLLEARLGVDLRNSDLMHCELQISWKGIHSFTS